MFVYYTITLNISMTHFGSSLC